MNSAIFQFQQFSVRQSHSAMKIGTDGVLLGAWAQLESHCRQVLDVGTGTGLIALMLAQRYSKTNIRGVELDPLAAKEAQYNFDESPWKKRLCSTALGLSEFLATTNEKYDHIVCNPPFYQNAYPIENQQRNFARNHIFLSLKELFKAVNDLLFPKGSFSLIVPYAQEQETNDLAAVYGLHLCRKTSVRGHASAHFKRVLLEYGRVKKVQQEDELTLEVKRHLRTAAYQSLVQDFYLAKS